MTTSHAAFEAVKHLDHRDVLTVLSTTADNALRESSALVHQLAPLVCSQQLLRAKLGGWTPVTTSKQLAVELNISRAAAGVLVLQRLQSFMCLLESHCQNVRNGVQKKRADSFDLAKIGETDLGRVADDYATNTAWPDESYWVIWFALAIRRALHTDTPISNFTATIAQTVVNMEAIVVQEARTKNCYGGMLDEVLRIRANELRGQVKYAKLAQLADECLEEASRHKADNYMDASLRELQTSKGHKKSDLTSEARIDAEGQYVYRSIAQASAQAAEKAGAIINIGELVDQALVRNANELGEEQDSKSKSPERKRADEAGPQGFDAVLGEPTSVDGALTGIAREREFQNLEDSETLERAKVVESIRRGERMLINAEQEEAASQQTSFSGAPGRYEDARPETEEVDVYETGEMPAFSLSPQETLDLVEAADAAPLTELAWTNSQDRSIRTVSQHKQPEFLTEIAEGDDDNSDTSVWEQD